MTRSGGAFGEGGMTSRRANQTPPSRCSKATNASTASERSHGLRGARKAGANETDWAARLGMRGAPGERARLEKPEGVNGAGEPA